PSPEQDTWLPAMYQGTQIDKRHLALPAELIRDVVHGTRDSGSVFLPSGRPDDRGPTTGQRIAHYAEPAPPPAIQACAGGLGRANLPAGAITHLVTVSCTGFFAPGLDHRLVGALGLRSGAQRTHVGFMGCHGALNGLRVARALTGADSAARVLL